MEIREFCERVLFTDRLDEKLERPDGFEDDAPGPPVGLVAEPGRPHGMAIDFNRKRVEFPGLDELERAEAHGRALHFFANHELLAIELMALTLLRFPEAPTNFRTGLARIIREEQLHLGLYRDRARALGVELGQYPLNGFFWRCLSDVHSPVEAMATLSLTLEQANLDYASYYARAFREIGAVETAQILDRVLADEIRHVAHGLRWFREWTHGEDDLFEAHARRLHLPMSMRRARGVGFDTQARLDAGLPRDYIERVERFHGSRGRPPDVYRFNPQCETEVLAPDATKAPSIVEALERDLDTLAVFVAKPDDIVLVHTPPTESFVARLKAAGVTPARCLVEVPDEVPHLGDLRPWGWSPVQQEKLRPLFDRVVAGPHFFQRPWTTALSEIHSKSFAIPILRAVLARTPRPWLIPEADVGIRETDAEAVSSRVREWHQKGHAECVIKAEFGTSGRNMIRARAGALESDQLRWVNRIVARHGAVVVEPWLDRLCDVSLRIQVDRPGHARVLHVGRFLTDARGQYVGGFTGSLSHALPPQLRRWANGDGRDPRRLRRVMKFVATEVGDALRASEYTGPVGVDAMIYRDRQGHPRLKPIVEINPRTTMGHICLAMSDRVVHGRAGLWSILSLRELAAAGFESPAHFDQHLRDSYPVRLIDDRIDSGALATTDPLTARAFVSVLFVGRDLTALQSMLPSGSRARQVWSAPDA